MDKLIKNETNKYAKRFYEQINNAGYKLIKDELFKNVRTPVQVKCDKGHVYEVTPTKFNIGRRCIKCHLERRIEIAAIDFNEQLEKEGYSLVDGEKYEGTGTPIKIKCNNDHVYETKPSYFKYGYRCKKCRKNSYKNRFYNLLKEEGYELQNGEQYTLIKEKLTLKCPKGHNYETTPENFMGYENREGKRCSECSGYKTLTTDQFKERVKKTYGDEITVLGEYTLSNKKILVRHNKKICNYYEWETIPSNFIDKGYSCPKCGGNAREGLEGFIKKVEKLVGNEYTVLGDYKNADTEIKIRHNNENCNFHEWNVIPYNFMGNASRCPACNEYRGEREISSFLTKHNIQFEPQYKFDDCIHLKKLSFDFAIIEKDKIKLLIEFDGKQHYDPVEHWGGIENLKAVQKRDNIKNKYTKDKNMKLLRIPYWDFEHIDKILTENLSLQHT